MSWNKKKYVFVTVDEDERHTHIHRWHRIRTVTIYLNSVGNEKIKKKGLAQGQFFAFDEEEAGEMTHTGDTHNNGASTNSINEIEIGWLL